VKMVDLAVFPFFIILHYFGEAEDCCRLEFLEEGRKGEGSGIGRF